jgi:hypothetical protein
MMLFRGNLKWKTQTIGGAMMLQMLSVIAVKGTKVTSAGFHVWGCTGNYSI